MRGCEGDMYSTMKDKGDSKEGKQERSRVGWKTCWMHKTFVPILSRNGCTG